MIETDLARIADSLERIANLLENKSAPIVETAELPPAATDVIMGASAIAMETGLKTSHVYRLSDAGELPTFKVGGVLAARRSELEAFFSAQRRVAA